MKKILFQVFTLLFVCPFTLGQDANEDIPKTSLVLNDVSNQKDIWALEFGSSSLVNSTIQTSRFNFVTGLDYFYEINLNNLNSFSFAMGLGYRYSSLSFEGVFNNSFDSINNHFYTTYSNADVSDSRLNIHKVRVPVELRFLIKDKIKLYFGYGLDFNLGMNNKFTQSGDKEKTSDFKDSHLINNSIKLRLGVNDFFLFTSYNMNSYFKRPKSPSINTIEFGISFGG